MMAENDIEGLRALEVQAQKSENDSGTLDEDVRAEITTIFLQTLLLRTGKIADEFGSNRIGTEHLLVGLIRSEDSRQLLESEHLDAVRIEEEAPKFSPGIEPFIQGVTTSFEFQEVMTIALRMANDEALEPQHLVGALRAHGQNNAASIMARASA